MSHTYARGNKFFDPIVDSFLSPEFASPNLERVAPERFEALAAQLGGLAVEKWRDAELGLMIHSATVHACEPSVRRILDGKPHNPEVADQVFGNLSSLFNAMVSSDMHYRIKNYEKETGNTMPRAHVGELAVLSGIWWLIRGGKFAPTSYALPVTSELEKGSDNTNPYYKTRTDLRFVNGDENGAKIDIQVKSTRSDTRHSPTALGNNKRPYAPGIPIVTPLDFAGEGSVEQDGKREGYKRVLPRLQRAFQQSTPEQLEEAYTRFQWRLVLAGHENEAWLMEQLLSSAPQAVKAG